MEISDSSREKKNATRKLRRDRPVKKREGDALFPELAREYKGTVGV